MKKTTGFAIAGVCAAVIAGIYFWGEELVEIEPVSADVFRVIENVEIPVYDREAEIVEHTAYSFQYNEQHEQADWVAYTLINDMLNNEIERSDDFRVDTMVSTGSAELSDYRRSGYDRGHLAPAADMKITEETMSESFYMSNMSPQKPGFNRGVWKRLEEQVRDWASIYDTLYIVTGPVLEDELNTIGENEVSIPNKYYKALLVYKMDIQSAIGFILENESSSEELKSFAVTIDSVEKLTSIDFFEKLPDGFENQIESTLKIFDWFTAD
ncbi:DNA/RNA non-specific endonuclease [Bacteroidota bacterium]